jgi:hypothetical protein
MIWARNLACMQLIDAYTVIVVARIPRFEYIIKMDRIKPACKGVNFT